MEGNLGAGDMISGGSPFGGIDLQGSLRVHHLPQYPDALNHHRPQPLHRQVSSSVLPPIWEGLSLVTGTIHDFSQTISMVGFNKGDRWKSSVSDEDDELNTYTEGGTDDHDDAIEGKKGLPWQRVKWTGKMVRLLITGVSYVGDGVSSDFCRSRRKIAFFLQKKGKWKAVSKAMEERGFHVSPQQCEDKFNDLNKRYKKLNDMLGRGTSCEVVENPALLAVIDYLTDSEKDDVRKILSSKHLFYEEMCSYHNGNRLHLPHDPALQQSLVLALRSRDDHDKDDDWKRYDNDLDEDDHDEFDINHASHGEGNGLCRRSAKRLRKGQSHEDVYFTNPSQDVDSGVYPHLQIGQVDMNQESPESSRTALLQKQKMESSKLQLEEQKLHIELDMLELEKQRFKWQRINRKRDRELERMRMENEIVKLENEGIVLELKRKELEKGTAIAKHTIQLL